MPGINPTYYHSGEDMIQTQFYQALIICKYYVQLHPILLVWFGCESAFVCSYVQAVSTVGAWRGPWAERARMLETGL